MQFNSLSWFNSKNHTGISCHGPSLHPDLVESDGRIPGVTLVVLQAVLNGLVQLEAEVKERPHLVRVRQLRASSTVSTQGRRARRS